MLGNLTPKLKNHPASEGLLDEDANGVAHELRGHVLGRKARYYSMFLYVIYVSECIIVCCSKL